MISVVIPVYNEEGNVRPLYERIAPALERIGREWEIIYVDDGSSDRTFSILETIHAGDPRVRIIRMRRNFGQTAALASGFDYSRGKYVITMDGDLQNDPDDIPAIVEKMDQGYQVVSGWRKDRNEKFLTRRFPSWVANRMISLLSGVHVHDYGCTLKGYDSHVVANLHPYGEMHRFLPALASLSGASYTEIAVLDHPRLSGVSKYGLSRVGKVFLDLVTLMMILHFSTKPRYWFGYLSFPFFGLGIITTIVALQWYSGAPDIETFVVLPGSAFLLFYGGFFLFSLGWISELITNVGTFRYGHGLTQVLEETGS